MSGQYVVQRLTVQYVQTLCVGPWIGKAWEIFVPKPRYLTLKQRSRHFSRLREFSSRALFRWIRDCRCHSSPYTLYGPRFLRVWKAVSVKEYARITHGFSNLHSICVGMNVANQTLFIDIACLLWALDFGNPRNKKGGVFVFSQTDIIDSGIVV